MTQTTTMPLPGQPAPALDLDLIIDAKWRLADQSPKAFTMIVFYRGLHCPICGDYLAGLHDLYDDFLAKGVEVINVSMDSKDKAVEAQAKWNLDPIPMGYGLTEEQARAWGLYMSKARSDADPDVFSEPGLAMVKPGGTLNMMEMGSAPYLRPDLKLLLSKLDFVIDKDFPPRGAYGG
ncbi:redoxin domain-containing protein [Jannaschia donghaensis]|uniref:AhpC/TSA family protein n=1 Tax=Jannaschia donghaensis TaxID=420998 RepID=A0A0M6YFA3_9RHOB|nr:redoxin domain-containing protein [Jannaschia donghaensis]CTQ49042.1 AhpC/TSA family protein [Jannaschia donghaensis]